VGALRLFTYFRSGAAHRVRIALALKGVAYQSVPAHLVRGGGEHLQPCFRKLNPQARAPVLQLPDGTTLIQTAAILEYLEETAPEPALLPADPVARAKARGVAGIIGSDIHPLNNVAVLNALRRAGLNEEAVLAWIAEWITRGREAVGALIGEEDWCLGPASSLADLYLVPQLFSARRFKVTLEPFRRIRRVDGLAATRRPSLQQRQRTNPMPSDAANAFPQWTRVRVETRRRAHAACAVGPPD
jgi:maleylacetoacetate isomerase